MTFFSDKNNPDIKYPPNNEGRQAIPFSRPRVGAPPTPDAVPGPLIDSWAEAPANGTYVLASVNGTIQWFATESCDE